MDEERKRPQQGDNRFTRRTGAFCWMRRRLFMSLIMNEFKNVLFMQVLKAR